MELRHIVKVLLRYWWIVGLAGLASLLYASYGYFQAPPVPSYTTSISFTAALEPEAGEVISYEDQALAPWTSSEYVANALADWARTSSFAEELSAALAERGVEVPPQALRGMVAADNQRSVLVLIFTSQDADLALQMAEASAQVLQERSAAYFPQLSTEGTRVVALDSPAVSPVPPPLSARFDPLLRLGLGLAAGVGLAFLIHYLDRSVREADEVQALGLPLLAEIPPHREG